MLFNSTAGVVTFETQHVVDTELRRLWDDRDGVFWTPFVSGAAGGLLHAMITNPLDNARLRVGSESAASPGDLHQQPYPPAHKAFFTYGRLHGFRSMILDNMRLTMCKDALGYSLFFSSYTHLHKTSDLPPWLAGGVAGAAYQGTSMCSPT